MDGWGQSGSSISVLIELCYLFKLDNLMKYVSEAEDWSNAVAKFVLVDFVLRDFPKRFRRVCIS